jgi:hypothetical protein
VEDSDSSNIAAWDFFGSSRTARVQLGNGLTCTWMNIAGTNSAVQAGVPNPVWGTQSSDRLGYDGAGRMISKRYTTSAFGNPVLVGFTTAFDRASNKFYERALHAENRSHLYEPFDATTNLAEGGYDSLDRLRQYKRGTLASTGGDGGNGGGSIATAITLPNTDLTRTYDLDGLGNWRNTTFTPEGGSLTAEVRQHNGLNQITRYKQGASAPVLLSYDGTPGKSNGNLAGDGTYIYTYDALNRMVEIDSASGDEPELFDYFYDALNRRIRKHILGDSGSTTDYVYSGWRCIEDRNPVAEGGDAPVVQYLWGIYLDEIIQLMPVIAINGFTANSPLYPLQDLLFLSSVVGVFWLVFCLEFLFVW